MIEDEILLYEELVSFCNNNKEQIEDKFDRLVSFSEFNKECYSKMFYDNRNVETPPSVKDLKNKISRLSEEYKKWSPYYLKPRNKYNKGLDIQLGQWYEKALRLFLGTKGISIKKKGDPYPDYEISVNNSVIGYFELKYIEAPFISANNLIKNTYPYTSKRYDYEASLTLDTGDKLRRQRTRIEELAARGIPSFHLWWFDCFHIKGIFAMRSEEVYDYYDHIAGNQLERKTREGDEETHQEIGKIYPPMLNMITFGEFINLLTQ